jgi:hypothetical protein
MQYVTFAHSGTILARETAFYDGVRLKRGDRGVGQDNKLHLRRKYIYINNKLKSNIF